MFSWEARDIGLHLLTLYHSYHQRKEDLCFFRLTLRVKFLDLVRPTTLHFILEMPLASLGCHKKAHWFDLVLRLK